MLVSFGGSIIKKNSHIFCMEVKCSDTILERFPDISVTAFEVKNVRVQREDAELEKYKKNVFQDIRENYCIDTVKDSEIIRRYRDFYWRLGIDPTKIRPASEALIRRILKGLPFPKINTLVDTYNLASMKTNLALAAFDLSTVKGDLTLEFATSGEEFIGIGMDRPITLTGKEPVIRDHEKTIAIYPYRDSDATKITPDTSDVLILVCGVPGISTSTIKNTEKVAAELITKFCGGLKA